MNLCFNERFQPARPQRLLGGGLCGGLGLAPQRRHGDPAALRRRLRLSRQLRQASLRRGELPLQLLTAGLQEKP